MEYRLNRRGFVVRLGTLALGGLDVRHGVSTPRALGAVLGPPGAQPEAVDVCCPQAYTSAVSTDVSLGAKSAESRARTGLELMFSNIRYAPDFFEPEEDETT